MKNLFYPALYIISVTFLLSCGESQKKQNNEWKLVWEEEFNQTNGFDTTYWTKIPRGTADWNNYMSDNENLYSVEDGKLILRGIVNTERSIDTVPFLTGGLYTKDKKTFSNGRIEIKAKLQGARGAWPAIWMLAQNAKWPHGGEIDIMERLNSDTFAYQTVHSPYTLAGNTEPNKSGTGAINPDDYNIYGVELYTDSLRLFINDTYTLTYPRIETDKEGQFPYNQEMYLLIDMQLGGNWVGSVTAGDLPIEMWIDWVRFYQK